MSCRARPLPTRRGKRCVPPPPGRRPSFTSGWPNLALSAAILMVHAIAVSQPPPSAKPLTAAITGLPRVSMRSSTPWPKRLDCSASIALACASSPMSAPAMNALSPAPVRMTPSTVASSRASSNAVRRSAQVGVFIALSTSGRFTVTYAIASFFSYRTLASAGVMGRALSSDAAEGARVTVAGAIQYLLSELGSPALLNEGAETRDSLPEDQILHLKRPFVGVERFAVGKEARDLVVGDNAVAAKQLAGPCNGLAALGRTERLGKRRVGVCKLALGMQLRLAHNQALRGGDVGDHFREQVLDQLERADRPAELQALLRVFERSLVGAHRASGRHPRHGVTCHLQDLRGVAERVAALKAVCFWHPNVLKGDVAVLDDL